MNLLILAYTSKQYKSEKNYIPCDPVISDRADLTRKLPCMDTWVSRCKHKNIEVIFFDGSNKEVSFDEKNQILHLTESDEYDYFYLYQENKPSNMLKKLKGAIIWLLENKEFDYILRVDDGTYVNPHVLESHYDKIKQNDIIWSGQGGGGGIFFSKKACQEILNIKNNTHLEDQSIFQHFSSLPDYKFAEIQSMSAFYNVGEKNLTIHYATGKRMYFIDFLISNYYNNTKTLRKVIINYCFDPNQPLNTNRVNGLNHNTGVWYGMDRDQNNWEYYGNYARSVADIVNREITYGDEVMKSLCVFNLYDDLLYKTENTIKSLHETIAIGGELLLFYNTIIPNQHQKIIFPQSKIETTLIILNQLNIPHTVYDNINIKKYLNAEYISETEAGTLIQICKKKMKKIYIAQYYTSNLTHGPYAEKINSEYCNRNGYGYYCEKSEEKIKQTLMGIAPTWYKAKLIDDVFNVFEPEYILFLDTDAIVSDFSEKIENFIDDNYELIVSEDVSTHSLMNAGVFLIKNTPWSKNFLKEWFECSFKLKPKDCSLKPEVSDHDLETQGFYSNRLWMDQTALTHLYNDKPQNKSKIKIISNRQFNWHKYNDNNFIFHAYCYGNIKNRTIDKVYNKMFKIEELYDTSTLIGLAEKYYTDKHFDHDYFKYIYQEEFSKIKDSAKKVVELGVHEGMSINIWREFFRNAKIIGIDCQTDRASIDNHDGVELINLTIGHNENMQMKQFSSKNRDIDLFIDDGSHIMRDQQETLSIMFNSIKSGGLYVLEDLHTSLSVDMDSNSIWKSDKTTTTLDMLENFNQTKKIESDYLTREECEYLEKNIKECRIFKLKPNWSFTSILTKK